ncbi:MAG: uncharacterized protein JWN07_1337 [Hyphomicrobiales bacterium]|nr:uncharacterized protein [Hyphomicrobiales bacterium]
MKTILLTGACALLLAGCGSTGSSIGNLIAFNSPTAPPPTDMTKRIDKVDCPVVDVLEGGGHMQIGSGSGLRQQFTIGDTSRECTVVNGQISIRVGVSGRVVAGPAGGPGSFTIPIRVGIRREDNQQIVTSKVFTVPASIPAGSSSSTFAFVSDPVTVPFTREEANEDYMVVVGIAKK